MKYIYTKKTYIE